MAAEAKNLEAISEAIDQHNANCPYPAAEVRMNPFEVERLGWEEIRGLPVVPDSEIGTGRFRIVCSRDASSDRVPEVEAQFAHPTLGFDVQLGQLVGPDQDAHRDQERVFIDP